MRTRTLGEGGPDVSVVGLGTNNFGARCDLEQSRAVLEAALEEGVTLVDTADIYSQGTSEEYIGAALEGRLDRIVIATKFGKQMDDGPDLPRGSRDYIRWAVEGSLRRLRADTIDVYQMHEPDPRTPIEEADRVARERGLTRFVSAQNHYSLVEREVEDEILPACERLGIGMLPYFPLASGLLTGKYTRGEAASEGRLAGREIPEERWDRLERLQPFADERGLTLLQVAIGGLAAMPAVTSVIGGATKPEQVRANVEAGEWEPTPKDLAALESLR